MLRLVTKGNLLNWGLLCLIVILGGYLRLSHLDMVPFKGDEATVANWSLSLVRTHQPLLVAPASSTGLMTPPAILYFMAIPLAISKDAALASGFNAALNLLAVILCYRFTAEYFGKREARVAALLYAASFWAVIFSRRIWDVSPSPLFALAFFAAIFALVVKNQPRALTWTFIWLSILLQFHFSALIYALFLPLILLIFRPKIKVYALLLGIVAFLAILSPYLYFEIKTNFHDIKAAASNLGSGSVSYDLTSFRYATHILSSAGYNTNFGPALGKDLSEPQVISFLQKSLVIVFYASLAYIILYFLFNSRRLPSSENKKYLLLLIWFFVPVLFYIRHSYTIYVHYFIILYPVGFVIVAVSMMAWLDMLPRLGEWLCRAWGGISFTKALKVGGYSLVGAFVGAQALSQLYVYNSFMSWIDKDTFVPIYGVPLKYSAMAAAKAKALSDSLRAPVYVIAHEDYREIFSFFSDGSFPIMPMNAYEAVVFPDRGNQSTPYVVTSAHTIGSHLMLRNLSQYETEHIRYPGGEDAFYFYSLPPEVPQIVERMADKPLSLNLENGVQLKGYSFNSPVKAGGNLTLTLFWKVVGDTRDPQVNYHFFTHLFDNKLRRWGQKDGIGYKSQDWRRGDTVVSWFIIPLSEETPLGQYWLHVGMYDLQTMKRVSMIDQQSSKVTDSVQLGPIKIVPRKPLPLPSIQNKREAIFDSKIALLGYDLERPNIAPGEPLRLRLYWQAKTKPAEDYSVFVHLLNNKGVIIAQKDGQPLDSRYPTLMWDVGEIVEDNYEITVPQSVEPGGYTIEVGWYLLGTMERLSVQEGQRSDDKIEVRIEVIR